MAWMCNKCKVEVEEVDDIQLFFKDLSLPEATVYRCPQCGVEYIDRDFVVDQLAAAEQMLEGK